MVVWIVFFAGVLFIWFGVGPVLTAVGEVLGTIVVVGFCLLLAVVVTVANSVNRGQMTVNQPSKPTVERKRGPPAGKGKVIEGEYRVLDVKDRK